MIREKSTPNIQFQNRFLLHPPGGADYFSCF